MNNLNHENDIAVVGMACRFPGADDYNEYWCNLINGTGTLSNFSNEELLNEGIRSDVLKNSRYVRTKGIINDVRQFDADLFGILPRDAKIMDPQQRLMLECAWSALDDAGYNNEANSNENIVGMFVGCNVSSYYMNNILNSNDSASDNLSVLIGNGNDYFATRLSYFLNLRGPSLTIQTACSSSLVCVHAACQALLSRECDMAMAGGVSITFPCKSGYIYTPDSILAPDGVCRPFDSHSSGTVFSDGLGIVVLKKLEDALKDNDNIRAIIKGSAVNNDGKNKVGYTTPSIQGQSEVIALAYDFADVDPDKIGYIEAHGTGTPIGDPIEIKALTNAFRLHTLRNQYCAIGSVKANIGHLSVAAGIAGFIKTVLILSKKRIPPQINYTNPSSKIDFVHSPFYVNREAMDWPNNVPYYAGVSSFGIGGTNAHVVLAGAPVLNIEKSNRRYHLLPLSANSKNSINNIVGRFISNDSWKNFRLADVAFTLQNGRKEMSYRTFIVADDKGCMLKQLSEINTSQKIKFVNSSEQNRCFIWLFSEKTKFDGINIADLLNEENFLIVNLFRQFLSKLSKEDLEFFYDTLNKQKQNNYFITFIVEFILANFASVFIKHPDACIGSGIGVLSAAVFGNIFTFREGVLLACSSGSKSEWNNSFSKVKPQKPNDKFSINSMTNAMSLLENYDKADYWLNKIHDKSSLKALNGGKTLAIVFGNELQDNGLFDQVVYVDSIDEKMYADVSINNQFDIMSLCFLGNIWQIGYDVDLGKLYSEGYGYKVPIPTYQFDRKPYWVKRGVVLSNGDKSRDNKLLSENQKLHGNSPSGLNLMEIMVYFIWKDVLELEQFDIDDNFFKLGGDSLHLISIAEKVGALFNISVNVDQLLTHQTVRNLAVFLGEIIRDRVDS